MYHEAILIVLQTMLLKLQINALLQLVLHVFLTVNSRDEC